MKFLKPNSVSGEILNLLDEANERVIIVSPYCKFDKWYRLVNKIKALKARNIAVEFYIRDGEQESYNQIMEIGIQPICIPNLHSKMYLNEKYGIVTSMNLLLTSEINSIEIGYRTETNDELKELLDFYATYLNKNEVTSATFPSNNWIEVLENRLLENFTRINIIEYDEKIEIKTSSNTYEAFIYNKKEVNQLRMFGILSGREFDYIKSMDKQFKIQNINLELLDSTKGFYNSIWGTFEIDLKSYNINKVNSSDSNLIITPIFDFINKVEEIKDYCYHNRKNL